MTTLERVLRYFKGTISIGIVYNRDAEHVEKLTGHVDSDHAGDEDKGYSTTRDVLCFSGGQVDTVNLQSKRT